MSTKDKKDKKMQNPNPTDDLLVKKPVKDRNIYYPLPTSPILDKPVLSREERERRNRVIKRNMLIIEKKNEDYLRHINGICDRNSDIIHRFFDIASRKVNILDEYGDENWDNFKDDLLLCLSKICKKENIQFDSGNTNRGGLLADISNLIEDKFRIYHKKNKESKKQLNEISGLSGIEFEQWIMEVLKKCGYKNVYQTKSSRDQGADIIVGTVSRKYIIQAKRYGGSVGNKAVQEVISAVIFYEGTDGVVVTNSYFTNSAKELANSAGIALVDGHDLKDPWTIFRKIIN